LFDYNSRYYDCFWCDEPVTNFETPAKDVFVSFSPTKLPEWRFSETESEIGERHIEKDSITIEDWRLARYWGWHAMLLPQMGQMPSVINFDEARFSEHNWQSMQMKIDSYTCPTAIMANSISQDQEARRILHARHRIPSDLGLTSYRGVRGYWADLEEREDDDELDEEDTSSMVLLPGMFDINRKTAFRDVADGESNTLMIGESTIGFWNDGFSCCASIHDERPDFYSYLAYQTPRGQTPGSQDDPVVDEDETRGNRFFRSQYFGFGGWHDGVSNFALVDGSVRSLSHTIDSNVLRALVTRNQGEQLNLVE
ncbi:MAG: DUF1559 domain-containing protein, partial [Planctomycetaceae bacterium]|nr:DUF1559 domain-containing protein [Planctomycetaceae bacterium]